MSTPTFSVVAGFLFLLVLTACQNAPIHPEAEDYRRLEQAYLNEVIAENQFDSDFAAHTLGDFYPVPFIVNADRSVEAFWSVYGSCNNRHGTKEATARLQQILSDHGLCMFAAATDAHKYFSDAQLGSIFLNPPGPPTKLFRYLYSTPSATDLFLSNSTTFVKRLPSGQALPGDSPPPATGHP